MPTKTLAGLPVHKIGKAFLVRANLMDVDMIVPGFGKRLDLLDMLGRIRPTSYPSAISASPNVTLCPCFEIRKVRASCPALHVLCSCCLHFSHCERKCSHIERVQKALLHCTRQRSIDSRLGAYSPRSKVA